VDMVKQFTLVFLLLLSTTLQADNQKALVVGASSGIGYALAKKLSQEGYDVGIVARRVERLEQLAKEMTGKSYTKQVDVSKPEDAQEQVAQLIEEMGGLDLMVLNAGVGVGSKELIWENQKRTLDVNVVGFTALATLAMNYFVKQKHGHLVGISSIAALRGLPHAAAYSASKAYVSNYLQGLRTNVNLEGLPIYVTDIKPGFILTEMTKDQDKMFWVASPEVAADQIYDAIAAKKKHAYVTKRWRLVAWILKIIPDWLYELIVKK